jgi:hypothetical protein
MNPAGHAIAAAVLVTGGEGAIALLPDDLAGPARAALAELSGMDRVRRATTLGRLLPALLRPAPAPDPGTLEEAQAGVPALGATLRTLGLAVPVPAPIRGARGPSRAVLAAVAAAVGPAALPVPSWCPPHESLARAGVRLLARAVGDLDARAAAEICRRVERTEAETIVALWRAGVDGDHDLARRVFAAASHDARPAALASRVGAYRVGWALGPAADAPAGWPAETVACVRRAQSAAALTAPPGDAEKERQALAADAAR